MESIYESSLSHSPDSSSKKFYQNSHNRQYNFQNEYQRSS